MNTTKQHILEQLKQDTLRLQGIKTTQKNSVINSVIGQLKHAFPGSAFPAYGIHEFMACGAEDLAVTGGFISGLLAPLMYAGGITFWISAKQTVFPQALKSFGIEPDKIIFIYLKKDIDILWVMEEALKCKGLAAVIGEVQELNFTASRRLQLAVEQSQATGFIIKSNTQSLHTTACNTRWKISSLQSESADNMPGVGLPRWNVQLIKVRNGQPGNWKIEFDKGKFRYISSKTAIALHQKKKAG